MEKTQQQLDDEATAAAYEKAAQEALAERNYMSYYKLSDLARKYRGWANTPRKAQHA